MGGSLCVLQFPPCACRRRHSHRQQFCHLVRQDLPGKIVDQAAGVDFFIGDANLLGKGWGMKILNQILNQIIWPKFDYCIVDPDIRNKAMIRCNEKVGFREHKVIHTEDALKRPVDLKLMIIKK